MARDKKLGGYLHPNPNPNTNPKRNPIANANPLISYCPYFVFHSLISFRHYVM